MIQIMLLGGGAPLSVSLDTTNASGSDPSADVFSNTVSATAHGGTGSYTYAWNVTTTDGIVAVSPTSASTSFEKNGALAGHTYNGTAVLTVTDAGTGQTTTSATVTITLDRTP